MAAASIAGLGLQAFGQLKAGQAEAQALQEQASVARRNAITAKQQAQLEADKQNIQARKVFGQQTAGFAAAGVSGASAEAVMADSMINAELDRLSILFGGDVRSQGFQTEAERKTRGAAAASEAGLFGLLSGGLQAGGKAADIFG